MLHTVAISPKSFIWPENTALGPAQKARPGNELGCFSSGGTLFFLRARPFRMRFARHWRFALLLFIGRFYPDGLRRYFPTQIEKAVPHRDVDSFPVPRKMGN